MKSNANITVLITVTSDDFPIKRDISKPKISHTNNFAICSKNKNCAKNIWNVEFKIRDEDSGLNRVDIFPTNDDKCNGLLN